MSLALLTRLAETASTTSTPSTLQASVRPLLATLPTARPVATVLEPSPASFATPTSQLPMTVPVSPVQLKTVRLVVQKTSVWSATLDFQQSKVFALPATYLTANPAQEPTPVISATLASPSSQPLFPVSAAISPTVPLALIIMSVRPAKLEIILRTIPVSSSVLTPTAWPMPASAMPQSVLLAILASSSKVIFAPVAM